MSPEQALAKRVPIDHRTDVYSLGATVYELLTLRPAFAGQDRQELLRQIAFEEPAAPRKVDRSIPAELETIVLKAMEKNPADRYATAQELADDLRRWLEDRPIKARRPSLRQVVAKWARRHRPVVWAAAVVLLVAGLLGGGTGLWWLQKRAAAEGEARAALQEATEWQEQEKWNEALGTVRRAKGAIAGVWASTSLHEEIHERERDLEMARQLQEARLQLAPLQGDFDWNAVNDAYAKAFTWYGLEVDNLDSQEAAEWVRKRSIRGQLVAALEDWAGVRWRLNLVGRRHLVAVCRLSDPDPWRDRLRDVLDGNDIGALAKVTASAPTDKLPPSTLVVLARMTMGTPSLARMTMGTPSVAKTVALERIVALLRQLQKRHPSDFWVNHELAACYSRLQPRQLAEAIRFYSIAVALRPQSANVHVNLGAVLHAAGRGDEAITELREAIRLWPDNPLAHCNLGIALRSEGKLDESIAQFRQAIRLSNNYAKAHLGLARALSDQGRLDEAIPAFKAGIRGDPDNAGAHYNLGLALMTRGRLDDAIACYRKAIQLKKDFMEAYSNLGVALSKKGKLDEAIEEYRKALRVAPDCFEAHNNLGAALKSKGLLEEAIVEYRKAILIRKDVPEAYFNLGEALLEKGDLDQAIGAFEQAIRLKGDHAEACCGLGQALYRRRRVDEAIAAYRAAIRFKKDYAEAYCNLGMLLKETGQIRQAVEALRRGHQLGSRRPGWPYPSAAWLREAEQLALFHDRLPAILASKDKPRNAAECLGFAKVCQARKHYAAATRFYAAAFAREPRLAANLQAGHRYDAACAAALAGCGQGKNAIDFTEKDRARHRKQALDWLRADLEAWSGLLKKDPDKVRAILIQKMQEWQADPDFNRLRGSEALTRLPEAERAAWQKLWADVAQTLARARGKALSGKKPGTK
jgi:tetratricopeptide (TPR) repeat protein